MFQVSLFSCAECSCKFKGKEICEGAVTKELGTLVKICVDGIIKFKKKSDVPPGYPLAGGGENKKRMNVNLLHTSLKFTTNSFQNVFGMVKCSVMG